MQAYTNDFMWSGYVSISLDDAGEVSPAPRHTDLVKLAQECCYHSNLAVAAHGITVLTSIAVSCPEKGWFLLTKHLIWFV